MTNEITVVAQYQTYLAKADITPTIDVTQLASLAKRASVVVVNDITNEAEMAVAKVMRKELSDARIEISKTAKLARDEFTATNRGIREVELILLEEFEAEENRLKGYETELKAKRLHDERALALPVRKERLSAIAVTEDDEVLLAMDDLAFSNFLAEKQAAIIVEKKRQEEDDARIKAVAEQAKADAEKLAKEQALEVERKHKAELAEIEEKRLAEVKAVEDAEKQTKADAKKLAKQKAYKQFLADHNYNEDADMLSLDDDTVKLYRLVATYIKWPYAKRQRLLPR